MTVRPDPALRILIGAESTADAPEALRLAPILARGSPAVFGGLLVVSHTLERPQSASTQRIVTTSGQVLIAPKLAKAKIILESEAQAFRKLLEGMARKVGAEWSATVEIGRLEASLASVADAWDVVIIGHRALHRRRGNVVYVCGDALANETLLSIAHHMASERKTDVHCLRVSDDEPAGDIADRLNRLNADAVIIDAAVTPLEGFRRLPTLLAVARCPIVILHSARLQPKLEISKRLAAPSTEAKS